MFGAACSVSMPNRTCMRGLSVLLSLIQIGDFLQSRLISQNKTSTQKMGSISQRILFSWHRHGVQTTMTWKPPISLLYWVVLNRKKKTYHSMNSLNKLNEHIDWIHEELGELLDLATYPLNKPIIFQPNSFSSYAHTKIKYQISW